MTQAEKAKAYDEIVQRVKELHGAGNALTKKQMEIICPELAESEDEKTRKQLLDFLEHLYASGKDTAFDNWSKADCTNWIAYIEKQKEQKPAEWSEEDNNALDYLHELIMFWLCREFLLRENCR